MRKNGFVPRRSLWELDHKIPLIDGGTHDLSNLQTLCVPCHREKSAREHSERAVRIRERERGASGGDGSE
jgi:5-methylcytosine-specific restriction endonuclease McrA